MSKIGIKEKKSIINFGQEVITYVVSRSNRKTVGISIDFKGLIKVVAPKWVSENQIKDVVFQKAPWILKKLAQNKDRNEFKKQHEFVQGEIFRILGENYELHLIFNSDKKRPYASLHDYKIFVKIPLGFPEEIYKPFIKENIQLLLKNFAKGILDERIGYFCTKMDAYPKRVILKQQKSRWGSCSSKGNININWKIIMAPLEVIDYLIVHELTHLKYMNHSKEFWTYVGSLLPDYKIRQKWLKLNQNILDF